MTGMPHAPSIPWQLMAKPRAREIFALDCARSAMKDGEKLIERIYFWLGVGLTWQAERLAVQLEQTTNEIEDFVREAESAKRIEAAERNELYYG